MKLSIAARAETSGLERFALEELQRYLSRLFGVNAETEDLPAGEGDRHVLGLRQQAEFAEATAPEQFFPAAGLSDQGFAIRGTAAGGVLRLAAGSPAALLWAVYELAEIWGVVYTLQEDIFPALSPASPFSDIDRTYEPRQRVRAWRLMSELYYGPVGWSLSRQTQVIGQLCKQKYNGIYLALWPHQPFVDFGTDGVSRTSATLNFGERIPLDADNIGREFLPEEDSFENPEFRGCRSFGDWHAAGTAYMKRVIGQAKFLGMRVCVSIQPFDFPREFAVLLEKPVDVVQAGMLTVAESGDLCNPVHIRLLQAQFDAYLAAYEEADEFEIGLPEHARSSGSFEEAWRELDNRFELAAKHAVEEALQDEATGEIAAGGSRRAENEGRMTLVMLNALHRILDRTGFLQKLNERGKRLSIKLGLSCPALLPVIADALWEGACLRVQTGYTSSRAVRNLRMLDRLDASRIRVEQIITLQDDNVGAFPQLAVSGIRRLVEYGCSRNWHGYVTRFWPTGELDPMSAALSRLSWSGGADGGNPYDTFAVKLCGPAAAPSVSQAFRLIEDATLLLDIELSVMLPLKGMMTHRVASAKPAMPAILWHVLNLYAEAGVLFAEAASVVEPGAAAGHLAYWGARTRFGFFVLKGMGAIQQGNERLASGDREQALAAYETAIGLFRTALEHQAICVRDDSDRALLAVYYHLLVRDMEPAVRTALRSADSRE